MANAAAPGRSETLRQIWISSAILATFAIVGSTLLGVTESSTRAQIEANEQAFLIRSLNQVLPPRYFDNDLLNDRIQIHDPEALGTEADVTVYRARKQGQAVAALFTVVAPDGYSGDIRLLVGVHYNGSLAGVRAVNHRETPGLGDAVDVSRSDWILGFAGRGLGQPPLEQWRVKKDGGSFDQFTGATITPRAVVKAVKKALLYFKANRDMLFASGAESAEKTTGP